ncbi:MULTISPECIES: GPW/gp25 family protein [Paenibacillus]|uniref:GPW/gp25 family protein n=1 Tax=Paenibacillus TaxID=44249 RepID=UPI0022B90E84|nr:GPW/gp25 family protein [Paenibacillus caseinilyticus]MCZ8520119.1 GPW/gp25 family protein [Paenibacillus caseinilyticus]
MEYTLNLQERTQGVIFGATGLQSIRQNLLTLLTTMQGTVPLDRGFGLDPQTIDEPLPVAQARYTAKILRLIRKYEPRVTVKEISFLTDNASGILVPVIRYETEVTS